MYLACPNRCSTTRFELWNASVFVDERGQYLAHEVDTPLYRCTSCGSPAVDLAEVPGAMAEERAQAARRVLQYTCPGCEALFAATAEQNPVVCPECGQTFPTRDS